MHSWIIRAASTADKPARTTLNLPRTLTHRGLKPTKGDQVTLLFASGQTGEWLVGPSASLAEVVPVDQSRALFDVALKFLRPGSEGESLRMHSLWMALSKADQEAIVDCGRSILGTAQTVSARGGRTLAEGSEFALGSALWLLRRHFGEVAVQILKDLRFRDDQKALDRWETALNFLVQRLQTLIAEAAHWATQCDEQYDELSHKLESEPTQSSAFVFLGQRNVSTSSPSNLRLQIDFAEAHRLINEWEIEVGNQGNKTARSKLLDDIQRIAASAPSVAWIPPYPGSLFNDI